jgi:hypothetical protein
VRLVYRDLIAILADDARPHILQRVASLKAPDNKILLVASNHGSGLSAQRLTVPQLHK